MNVKCRTTGIDSLDFLHISFASLLHFPHSLDVAMIVVRELKIVWIVNKNVEFMISIRIIITTRYCTQLH